MKRDGDSQYLEYKGLFFKIRNVYFNKIVRKLEVKQETRILDFGCGPGDFLRQIARVCDHAVGIDSSARSVDLAERQGLQNVMLGDENHKLLVDQKFDVIVVQSVLEHVLNPIEVFSKLYSSLEIGGKMVVSVPTPAASFWDDPTHVRPFTPKALKSLVDFFPGAEVSINYVFLFLLGLKSENQVYYRLLNWIPLSLGTNLIAIVSKNEEN